MPKEPRLDMLPDKDMKLSGSHFRKVVRRIESIVPLAGDGIKVEPKEGGYEISNDAPAPLGVCGFANQGYSALFDIIELNVCSNGTPDVVLVYAPRNQNNDALLCEA